MDRNDVSQCKRRIVTWRGIIDGDEWLEPPDADDDLFQEVYVIMDSVDVPIYVGCSVNVPERLLSHVERGAHGWTGATEVGRYILGHSPESLDWRIELLYLRKRKEHLVISMYNPWFNDMHRTSAIAIVPTPTPEAEGKQDFTTAPSYVLGLRISA